LLDITQSSIENPVSSIEWQVMVIFRLKMGISIVLRRILGKINRKQNTEDSSQKRTNHKNQWELANDILNLTY